VDPELPIVIVPPNLLQRTWLGLRERSGGQSEAACVWIGDREGQVSTTSDVLFPQDYGPVRAGALHHVSSRRAMNLLFEDLRRRGKQITADIHTHPPGYPELSEVDRAHPVEFRPGLLVMVVPDFARGAPLLSAVSAYLYVAGGRWRRLGRNETASAILVRDV